MKVGFTGSRDGMSQHQKEQFVITFDSLGVTEFHHGDCVGADAQAHDIVREFFPAVKIVVHPPRLTYKRAGRIGDEMREPDDYIPRDKKIVEQTEYLIGAPLVNDPSARSGTWFTIRYSRKLNRPNKVLER